MIAWLWSRTVKSPNPAFADVEVPLVSTFMLSTKKGKEAYVEPLIKATGYRFTVKDRSTYCRRRRKGRHQAGPRCQLPMPDVRHANRSGVYQVRRHGRPHGRAIDGHRSRG